VIRKISIKTIALLALALTGCGPAFEERGVAVDERAIVGGTASTAAQDFVVLIVGLISTDAGTETFQCSGSLLAPNLVLTARHCVSRTAEGAFACDEQGNLVTGSTGGRAADDYPANELLVFTGPDRPPFSTGTVAPAARGKTIVHDSENVLCSHDIALLVLDRPIAGAVLTPLRLDAPATAGESLTAIGWGITATMQSPSTRQQRAGVTVLRVGPSPAPPDGSDGAVAPSELEVGESICQGDSGGPAVSESTGAVIGCASAGGNGGHGSRGDPAAGCAGPGTFNFYTEVAPFKALVLDAFAQAGAQPWLEGQPPPAAADAGVNEPPAPRGCGCSALDPGAPLLLLGLAALRRRRRSP
jgi:uncharacterized protein (TIGR03382 family)